MRDRIRNEPVMVSAAVTAALNVALAFGLNLSTEQTVAVNAAVAALVGLYARSKVTPVP